MARKIQIDFKPDQNLIFKNKKYLDGKFNYPSSATSVMAKDKNYHIQWAEKIYNLFLNRKTFIPGSLYDKIDELRAWSDGKQDTSEVLDWLIGKKNKAPDGYSFPNGYDDNTANAGSAKAKRKAWSNIDTNPVSVFPKIKSKIQEHIRSMYYEMGVNAIDSYSVRKSEFNKYYLWFYKKNKKWLDSQRAMAGLEPDDQQFVPDNLEELELYAATGGFKLPYTISMEDLLRHTFDVSGWDKDVAEKIRDDLMTIGYAVIREEFDRELNRVVVRYSNLKYSGVQYGDHGFKDSEFGYELQWVEMSKIRQRLNLTAEEAAGLAYKFSGLEGNPQASKFNEFCHINQTDEGIDIYGFDFYKIPVFNFEFIDIDNENYLSFSDRFGQNKEKAYKGEIQDGEKLETSQHRYVREGRWLVGTQYMFDYGKKEYIPRDNFMRPRISYRAVKLNTEPILQQVLSYLRGLQLSWMKLQQAIALAVGNGFAVDIGSIKNIAIGKGDEWNPLEVLEYYRQSTFMLYRTRPSLSGLSRYSGNPIIPLNNSSYENIKAQFEAMNFFMNQIENTCGISMVSTGSTPDPDVAKFNMQVSVQGTNDIINNIARAQTDLQEDISVNICYRIRTYCHYNDFIRKSYESVIGENRMKAVMEAEQNHVEYGITIEASDITEEKRDLMAVIQAAITPSGGEPAKLGYSEVIQIMDMIHQRQNLRRIALIVGNWTRRKERQIHQQKLELVTAQGQQLNNIKLTEAQIKQQEDVATRRQQFEKFTYDYIMKFGHAPNMEELASKTNTQKF